MAVSTNGMVRPRIDAAEGTGSEEIDGISQGALKIGSRTANSQLPSEHESRSYHNIDGLISRYHQP